MEGQRETRRRSLRGVAPPEPVPPAPVPVRRRSARHMAEVPEKQTNVVFAPSDPYSAAMDDMPLKDLFPNMKVRKRPQKMKKVDAVEVPSPKSTESDESVRSKLRDSLAAALKKIESAEWEQERGQDFKADTEKTEEEAVKSMEISKAKPLEPVMLTTEEALIKEKADHEAEPLQGETSLLTEGKRDSTAVYEGGPFKRIKLEDGSMQTEAAPDLVEKLAFDIEIELYRHFGGVNKKYKEKARSLLFNLKDRSNPELRLRVLAGEITPENLCSMNAEQLASKELSEWRIAKAEELAQMVVLNETNSEQPRLVKKTHKGEIEVGFEKEDVLTDVMTAGSQQGFTLATEQQEAEDVPADVDPDSDPNNEEDDPEINEEIVETEEDVQRYSPIQELNLTDGIANEMDQSEEIMMADTGEEFGAVSQDEEKSDLPAILSLDEFVGSKKVKESKVSVNGDELDLKLGLNEVKLLASSTQNDTAISSSPTITKERISRKVVLSPNRKSLDTGSMKNGTNSQKDKKKEHILNEKLWEGSFQLSGSQIPHVVALFKSGDGVELDSWPKLIEIKGRVRLDALEKFLQELRLSRTRAVMVIACTIDEGKVERGVAVNALKEAANQYQRGERVGYAEPVQGYELYLFPGGGTSLKLLIEHGYLNTDQVLQDEEGILIGFVVCRRNTIPTNTVHKSSSHYFSANRHALSAQLDSPTRPSEIQWTGNVVRASGPLLNPLKDIENHGPSLAFVNLQGGPTNDAEGKGKPQVQQLGHEPAELSARLGSGKAGPEWRRKESAKEDDADDDLPPGFGPKVFTRARHSVLDDDDDDLPEYDFSSQNPTSLFTSMKGSDVGSVSPFNMQTAYTQGLPLNPFSQSRQGVVGVYVAHPEVLPYEQHNLSGQHASQFLRPIVSHMGAPLDQPRPLLLSSSQGTQPLHFHPMAPRPPPGPPPGPPPFGVPPSRPPLQGDASFLVRMPLGTQTAILPGEGSFNQSSQTRPTQVHDEQRTKGAAPSLQSNAPPLMQALSGSGQRNGGNKGSSLWDDDDMPEWCPPTLMQQSDVPPRPSVLQSADSGVGSAPLGIPPVLGGGWQNMQVTPSVGEGRGLLQAPLPAMRYPNRASGSHFSATKLEKFTSDRAPSIRPNETRGFKGAK